MLANKEKKKKLVEGEVENGKLSSDPGWLRSIQGAYTYRTTLPVA